jgi:FAD/FMN-containing dehydrogenase/Fe-S oxidoreductase
MDPDRARILADLSGVLDGEIRCDDIFLQAYSSDASLYEIKPLAVVRPRSLEDVVSCVKYAGENQLSVVPRGSGSNVIGGSIGAGIILDFSFGMRQVIGIDRESARVQPGVAIRDLNRQLEPHQRFFSPDPATRSVTTIGGALAMNRTGSHWVDSGTPRDKLIELQMVMADGSVVRLDSAANQSLASSNVKTLESNDRVRDLQNRIGNLLQHNEKLVKEYTPETKLNQAGYHLQTVMQSGQCDLTRLVVGSEGTLGIITEAVLKTDPLPQHRGVALLFFHQLQTAATAAVEIGKMGITACDLMDRRLLTLARETDAKYQRLLPMEAEAMLLVEFNASDDGALREKLQHLTNRIQRRKKLAFEVRTTTQPEERRFFWHLVRRVVPSLYRLRGLRRAVPFIEDIAIDPIRLPEFLKRVHAVLNDHDITASIFSHTPQGMVHIRPFLNLADQKDIARMKPLAKAVFGLTLEMKGSISGSQGDGLGRTWFLRSQYGKLHPVFSEIKNAFDTQNVLNPGKIVGLPYSDLTDHLRIFQAEPPADENSDLAEGSAGSDVETLLSDSSPQISNGTSNEKANGNTNGMANGKTTKGTLPILEPQLDWSVTQIGLAARNCNGCGRCRTNMLTERMCPVFRASPREEASPRAKANLMRGVISGNLSANDVTTDEFKNIADLCFNCHQCRIECPASVDIPKLMIEAKAQYFATNGLKISDWILTRLDWLYGLAGKMPRTTNRMIRSKFWRWTLHRVFGIAQGRKLPLFSNQTFTKWAQRNQLTRPSRQQSRKVVYFVDAYVNWNDPELGRAFVEVLKHNNIEVLIPPNQGISGMSLISDGAISRARKIAESNVELLAEWVRQGYQIVTTEPSAALALKHEYLALMDDEDASLVAEKTTDCCSFLNELHRNGELALDFKPMTALVGYHLPCHQKAILKNTAEADIPAVKLMRLVPGLQVEVLSKGCSGMAGTFGLKAKNYRRSLRIGVPLMQAVRAPNLIASTTECSSCKIQMEQGTYKPTIHPIKILAKAYGLMPELEDLMARRSEELVVT